MSEKLLHKYYLRLKTEGLLKATLWGLAVGFGALAVLGMLYWVMGWKSAWVCWLVWAVFSASATSVFYYWKFKPTTKYIARRVDDLGLHERILTMTELEGDESYIAKRQREDALSALTTIRSELLTIGVSLPSIITALVAMLLGICGFLFASGVFKSFNEVRPIPTLTYTVTYAVKNNKGGTIEGVLEQTIVVGERTEGVVAVPEDGWRFLKWTVEGSGESYDEFVLPYRADEVFANKTYFAVFIEMEFDDLKGLPEDKPDDAPGDGEESSNETSNDQDSPERPQQEYEEVNQIIDGQTYYGDQYNAAYEDALEDLADEKYTGDQKEIGGGYFDNIEKNDNEENN